MKKERYGAIDECMGSSEHSVKQAKGQREIWVDNVKVVACILVVLGHFFQSMTKSNVLPANDLYQWFNQTIYYFHVPLFFICSGYLYQKLSVVTDVHSWGKNVLKKIINLGVPYFAFSFATWLLKTVFAGSVNSESGGLFDTLFLYPASPYWYLYALFFLFLITPTFRNKSIAVIGLLIALVFKVLGTFRGGGIQIISYILSNEIWFVIGMYLNVFEFKKYLMKKGLIISIATGVIFFLLSIWVYMIGINHGVISFLLGLLACFVVITLIEKIYENRKQSIAFGILAKYTMAIFLMHTLFAAPLRTVLFKAGIQSAVIHMISGIAISFIGPMIAAVIMKKTKWLEFFLYPGKFFKMK